MQAPKAGVTAPEVAASAADDPKTKIPAKRERAKRGAIILARHGQPMPTRNIQLDWEGFEAWWRCYEEQGLVPGQRPPFVLQKAAAEADIIFASPAPRALATAQAVADGKPIEVDPGLIEAPLPPPRYPKFVRMKPKHSGWGLHARLAWWFGKSRGTESRKQAEARAAVAAGKLADLADQGKVVLVCAHGWFNRMMRPELKRRGWRCVYDGGDKYWSSRRYEKPKR